MSSSDRSEPTDVFIDDPVVRETMEIEHRLRDAGYWNLPDVLELAGDFDDADDEHGWRCRQLASV